MKRYPTQNITCLLYLRPFKYIIMSNKLKLASTVLLARDHNETLEVLLLKRNKALAFAGGLWVFPGGKIEPYELEQSDDELSAAKLAGVRETKEETNLDIESDSLIFFRHWTTPVIQPRRFATYFFFGGIQHAISDVTIDDSEIKKHFWVHPQKALDELKGGNLAMLPPTLMSLQMIRKCNSVAEATAVFKEITPTFVLPNLQVQDGKMVCLYEGDAGFETGNAEAEGPRHRLIYDLMKGDFQFEFRDCKDVIPVSGGMHL